MRGPILGTLALGTVLSACSLAQSLDDYTNGAAASSSGTNGNGSNGTTNGAPIDDGSNRAENVAKCGGDALGHCTTPTPDMWKGPFALYEGAAAAAPECTKVMDDAFAELNAPPASCGCKCGGANNFACSTSVVTSKNGSCTPCAETTLPGPGSCTPLPKCSDGSDFSHVMMKTAHVPGTGSCAASSSGKTLPPVAWGRIARACELTQNDQGASECSGNRCVSAPTSPFFKTACIAYEGDVACPAGPYSLKKTFHRDITEGRDCKCTCGAANVTCGGNILFVPGLYRVAASCGTNNDGIGVNWNSCVSAPSPTYTNANYASPSLNGAGSCPPVDTPSGTATPNKPVTICCM